MDIVQYSCSVWLVEERATAPELIVFRFRQWLIKHSVHFPGECHFLGIRWGISIIFLPRSLIRNWRPDSDSLQCAAESRDHID